MKYIGKLLPIDGYYVRLKESLTSDYSKSLTHLYQPLIGIQSVMLYYTLLHEIEMQQDVQIQTHHTLMNYLNLPLDEIYKARLKLEGIGLLNTYEDYVEDSLCYFYELKSPFSPNHFFRDAMLSQLLFHYLGEEKFKQLKKHYKVEEKQNEKKDITASFNDVFETVGPPATNVESITAYQKEEGPNVEPIDFSWIEYMLKQRLIPAKKVLTRDNKRIIKQMMTLYNLTSHDIENILLWSLTEDNKLNVDEFKEACHTMLRSYDSQKTIQLAEKDKSVVQEENKPTQPKTKEEMLIRELETISPKQLLADLSNGNQASEQDMRIIRDVMASQGLPSPVMNVLIHYVLLQSNMKLSKAYMEKIASHWSRANLKTAKEAMEFAKREQKKFQQGKNTKQSYRQYNRRSSNEVIPDWFKERKTSDTNTSSKDGELKDQKEKEELELLLKQYTNQNH